MPFIKLSDPEILQLIEMHQRELDSATSYINKLKLALSKLSPKDQSETVSRTIVLKEPNIKPEKKRGRPRKTLTSPPAESAKILTLPLIEIIADKEMIEAPEKVVPARKKKKKKRGGWNYREGGMVFLKPMAKPLPKPRADDPFITEANRKWL